MVRKSGGRSERASALEDGFRVWQVDGPENLVRIPTLKHWEITGWYNEGNEAFGDMSPRDYLRGKDWNTRRRVGLYALTKFGVLKR